MDQSLLKADIFFFVATVAVVMLTVMLVVGLLYVVSILRTIKRISRTAQAGAETVVQSIQEAKAAAQRPGFGLDAMFAIISKLFRKNSKQRK